jgi:hypothetical protein
MAAVVVLAAAAPAAAAIAPTAAAADATAVTVRPVPTEAVALTLANIACLLGRALQFKGHAKINELKVRVLLLVL